MNEKHESWKKRLKKLRFENSIINNQLVINIRGSKISYTLSDETIIEEAIAGYEKASAYIKNIKLKL